MLERLTADAQVVVADAAAHARRLQHRWIGCEHLLLAACGHGDEISDALNGLGVTPAAVEGAIRRILDRPPATMDADALATIGIDLDAVRRHVEAIFGHGALSGPESRCRHPRRRRRRRCEATDDALRFTPRAKKALDLAVRRARADGRVCADVSDLTSTLTDVPGSMARRILDLIGVSPEQVRHALGGYRRAG